MKFVSPFLKRVVYPGLASSGHFRRLADRGTLCVVTYHGILPAGYEVGDPQQDGGLVSAENFRSQLRLLKSRYRVVSPEEVRLWAVEGVPLPQRSVLLTCDDGLLNTLTDMAPILQEEGLSCLFFILGASAGQVSQTLWYEDLYLVLLTAPCGTFSLDPIQTSITLGDRSSRRLTWWNLVKSLSPYDQSMRMSFLETARARLNDNSRVGLANEAQRHRFCLLNAHELQKLLEAGMSIGSHTLSHPVLSLQSTELAWREISESRTQLEKVLGKPVWALAYPYGDSASVTAREQQMAEQAGFQCAFMNVGGGFNAPLPRFALPRVHVTKEMSLAEFEAHVSGFHRALQSAFVRA
jgi:peptidoglycan/xylan/chitin deacetylase (PgdA/CDA1 family)